MPSKAGALAGDARQSRTGYTLFCGGDQSVEPVVLKHRDSAQRVFLTGQVTVIVIVQLCDCIHTGTEVLGDPDLPVLAIVTGGLLFGAGMVLTRGGVSRLTVLGATGNLRAPTLRVGKTVVVGFNDEAYSDALL